MNARLADDLASCPLDELVSTATKRLRAATLNELAEWLRRSDAPNGAPTRAPTSALATEADIARSILALPGSGSKLAAAERAVVLHALDVCKGNVSAASRLLGVDRKSLERKIRRIRRAR